MSNTPRLVPITSDILRDWRDWYTDFRPGYSPSYEVRNLGDGNLLIYGRRETGTIWIACTHAEVSGRNVDIRKTSFPHWIRDENAVYLVDMALGKRQTMDPEVSLDEIERAQEVFHELQGR